MYIYIFVSTFIFGFLGLCWNTNSYINVFIKLFMFMMVLLGIKLLWNFPLEQYLK